MKEYEICLSPEIRERYMERTEILDKVKKLFLIPGMEVMTTKQVADYFEVDVEVIKKAYQNNKDEIESDGTTVKKVSDFKREMISLSKTDKNADNGMVDFGSDEMSHPKNNKRGFTTIALQNGSCIEIANRGARCFSKRAILRIAMLLNKSEVAKEVRMQLIADETGGVAESRIPKMDEFDLLKSLVNQKFGEVRVLVEDGAILFCGSDVAKALGYANPNEAILDHCKNIAKRYAHSLSKIQNVNFITEGDVYRLIIRSKLPEAEEFEHWLFDEMLPTLRKSGGYVSDSDKLVETYFKDAAPEIKGLVKASFDRITELQNANLALTKTNEELEKINKLLSDGVNTWDNKAVLNAMVRSATVHRFHGDYGKAWNTYYKQLLYKGGINLTSRNGDGSKIGKIKPEEWKTALQVGAAWLMNMGLNVAEVINSVNAAAIQA